MEWNDLRHFLALARTGSVRAAGEKLGVSHSTVARRVEALEEQLKTRLFDRHRDGYTLTEAGRQMVPGAERIEEEMNALERGLLGQDERLAGRIALTCCDAFISNLVVEDLVPFCEQHPDIDLSFTTDSRPFDLSKREADIAIRTLPKGAPPPEHLIGKKLAPVTVCNYVAAAHQDRLDPAGPVRCIAGADRKFHEMLIGQSSYPQWLAWGSFSTLDLMLHAALQGLGVAVLPTYVGDPAPGLVRLPHADLRHLADLWLLCHPDLRDNARFRAMRKAIADAFARRAELFSAEA